MFFLLASPIMNPIIFGMLFLLPGWHATVAYGLVLFAASIITGIVLHRLGLERDVKEVRILGQPESKGGRPTFGSKLLYSLGIAWNDFRSVLKYLVVGVIIGAGVYGYVPQEIVVKPAGPGNALAIPVAVLIGIPLYVRAETIIPIGVALTSKGMGIGAVIALVIGGAGMSIPEMTMLASIFRPRLVAIFVGFVFVSAVSTGVVFSLL